MFSVAPNIVLAPNMTQNAERKHRTQNTNTAHIRLHECTVFMDSCRLPKTIQVTKDSDKQKFHAIN